METSFQRANRLADEAKARKRREYEVLCKQHQADGRTIHDMFVDYNQRLVAVLTDTHTGAARRSTRNGRMYDHFYMYLRPTEDLAFIAARGENSRDQLFVVRQEPSRETRYCYGCKVHHPLTDFDWIARKYPQPSGHVRIPPGYRWYCRLWLRKQRNGRAA